MIIKLRFLAAIALVCVAAMALGQDFVPGELLVKFKPNRSRFSRTVALLHSRAVQHLSRLSVDRLKLPSGVSVRAAVSRFASDPEVEYAEPNYIVRILDVNDPFYSMQWNLKKVQAPQAWGITHGSPTVLVAMLDTGVDLTHPDLVGRIAGNKNFISFGAAQDGNGHGTHTAGVVAANTDNGRGVASLGYQTRLLVGKVATDNGQGTLATVAEGIEWAADNGAKVISMSVGLTSPSNTLRDAIDDAWSRGIVLVAAAGNNGSTQRFYPAAYDNCIAVAATDEMDKKSPFSNYGDWVDVAAPGSHIISLYKKGGVAMLSGTSMATPHVAALAALLWANGGRSNLAIRIAITNSGDPTTGFGLYPTMRINARRALLRVP